MIKVVKKGIVLPFILILASIALILGAFFLLDKQKTASQNPTESASPSPANETTNWKTYTNTEVGYSIKYPEYFEVDAKNERSISIFREENVSNPKYGGPDRGYGMTIYSRTFGNKEYQSRPIQKTQVGMYSATRWTDNPNYMEDIWVDNPNGKNAAHITISTFAEKPPFDKNDFEVFNQILSTFKFTDQSLNTTNWKTYTNKKFGFEFKYPDDYELVEDITYPKGPSEVFSVGIGPNWAEFCCDPWLTITKEGISQAIEKEKTLEEDAFTTKEEKISVANLPATKIVTFNKGLNKDSFINVLLANNGYVFNFATNYVPDGADLFYSFISTFRFD